MSLQAKDWTGARVGNLTVLHEMPRKYPTITRWRVRCDCGRESEVDGGSLTSKLIAGTGMCQAWCPVAGKKIRESVTKHGACSTPEYKAWTRMKNRCYQKSNPSYARYGGMGLEVDPKWRKDFKAFLADMGPMPKPRMSVDRIDNSKGYFKENCRWATPKEQANNRCTNIFIDTPWGRMTISEAAEKSGIPYSIMVGRVRKGKPGKDIFRPVRTQNEKFQTAWGPLTIKEACAKTGLSPRVAWSRLERGITDPEILFSTRDLRKDQSYRRSP